MQVMMYYDEPEKSSLGKIAFNNAKATFSEYISELAVTLMELQKVAPELEIIEQFGGGDFEKDGYHKILDNMPTTFGLVENYDYKKKYVVVEANFKLFNIKTEIYTFILHTQQQEKEKGKHSTWNYHTCMTNLQEEGHINPKYDYFQISDLFKSKTDKELQKILFKMVGRSTFKTEIDIWYS